MLPFESSFTPAFSFFIAGAAYLTARKHEVVLMCIMLSHSESERLMIDGEPDAIPAYFSMSRPSFIRSNSLSVSLADWLSITHICEENVEPTLLPHGLIY